jgi:hypothetical protein
MLAPGYFPAQGSTLIRLEHVLPDQYEDILGAKIHRLQAIDSWTAEKRKLQRDLAVMSTYFGYIGLWVDPRSYLVSQVGQSFIYDVPLKKRGNLSVFRGKRIRIICLGSGAFTRWIRVGPLNPIDVETTLPEARSLRWSDCARSD